MPLTELSSSVSCPLARVSMHQARNILVYPLDATRRPLISIHSIVNAKPLYAMELSSPEPTWVPGTRMPPRTDDPRAPCKRSMPSHGCGSAPQHHVFTSELAAVTCKARSSGLPLWPLASVPTSTARWSWHQAIWTADRGRSQFGRGLGPVIGRGMTQSSSLSPVEVAVAHGVASRSALAMDGMDLCKRLHGHGRMVSRRSRLCGRGRP